MEPPLRRLLLQKLACGQRKQALQSTAFANSEGSIVSPQVIDAFFGRHDWNRTGKFELQKQLYFSLLGQALVQVRQIQEWRATNIFGTLFWMFNEIWPVTSAWDYIF